MRVVADRYDDLRTAWENAKVNLRLVAELASSAVQWVDEHSEEISKELSDFWEKAKRHREGEWAYLFELTDFFTGVGVMLSLEAKRRFAGDGRFDDSTAELIERGLREKHLIGDVRDAIGRVTLPSASARQLLAGVDYFAGGDDELAVPLLINPLEGAFWRVAAERGLIEQNRKGKWIEVATRRQIDSVEGLFRMPELGVDETRRRFLTGLAYGGSGNPYRHGTAEGGYRLRALCLFAALLAWLELSGEMEATRAVREAFVRDADRRRAEGGGAGGVAAYR